MSDYKFQVEELKTRLDKYLAENIKEISRSQIQRDIEAGSVLVNGKKITESKFVARKGDKVRYKATGNRQQDEKIKPTNTPLKVLYDDHGLLIIDKPAGMVVHPGAGFKGETLASALLYQFSAKGGSASGGKDFHLVGEENRPGIVHRLDKDTSGVMLVAKTKEVYEYLKNAFLDRKIKKEYIALVMGRVEKPHGFIDTPIGKSKRDFRKYETAYEIPARNRYAQSVAGGRNNRNTKKVVKSKEAFTEYQVLEYLGVDPVRGRHAESTATAAKWRFASNGIDTATLLLVKLHTGRTHQIRVHFNSINHPLMGDKLYGGKRSCLDGLNRQFLHAKKTEVRLPDSTWIEAESQLPADLRTVLISLNSKLVNNL